MEINNIHSRVYTSSPEDVGSLIDTLSSNNDLLWPHKLWPKMKFDKPLSVGAKGGHGPIRYFVEEYSEGQYIKFRFTGPNGFDGFHEYCVIRLNENKTELVHKIKMNTRGVAIFTWPFVFCPMHNALMEDSLSFGELHLSLPTNVNKWSFWVRLLRWLISGGKGRDQIIV